MEGFLEEGNWSNIGPINLFWKSKESFKKLAWKSYNKRVIRAYTSYIWNPKKYISLLNFGIIFK